MNVTVKPMCSLVQLFAVQVYVHNSDRGSNVFLQYVLPGQDITAANDSCIATITGTLTPCGFVTANHCSLHSTHTRQKGQRYIGQGHLKTCKVFSMILIPVGVFAEIYLSKLHHTNLDKTFVDVMKTK